MNRNLIITLSVIGVLLLGALSIWGMFYTSNKKELQLRNLANAEIQKVEVIHDQMWKTISQEAQVTSEYKASFDSIYTHIMEGRYSGGSKDGSLMKWIQESNPNFTPDLYKKLMIDIEALREKFSQQQIKVEDVIREHNNTIQDPFYSIFIKNTTPIEYKVISSKNTKNVIETREDNEVDLSF